MSRTETLSLKIDRLTDDQDVQPLRYQHGSNPIRQTLPVKGANSRAKVDVAAEPETAEPVLPCYEQRDFKPVTKAQRWFRSQVIKKCHSLRGGTITLVDADGVHRSATTDESLNEPFGEIQLQIADGAAYSMIALGGELGFADALVAGHIRCTRLAALVRLLVRNIKTSDEIGRKSWNLRAWIGKLQHWARRNTQSNSQRNIAAHYDLSNDFFKLWLDPTMSYSSGVFGDLPDDTNDVFSGPRSGWSMQQASEEKLRRVCEKLELKSTDRLLEIGCGWGGLAIYAAQNYGCHVTGVTLSKEQLAYATAKVKALGLEDRIDLRLMDYRQLTGQYDKLVSIEMIEAVGHQFLDQYFQQCSQLLKPQGRMVIQAITIAEHRYESYLRNVDFIRQYIFPGGSLPSVGAMLNSVARVADFRPTHLEDIGSDYAETLRRWRIAFHHNLVDIEELGFDQRFQRTWDYYLAYCEGAFDEGHIGTVQLVLDKPGRTARSPELCNRLSAK